jgi:hypothetical protein
MANLRVISDNAIDRAALSASSTAGAFAATNLQLARKSDVWRATGTTARLTATWAAAEPLQAVALPFCNLSPTATMRVRVTGEASVTNLFSYSEQPANAVWAKTATTVTGSAGPAPDGSTNASYLKEDTTASSAHEIRTPNVTLAANTAYTMSVFAKGDTRRYLRVGFSSVFSSTAFSAYIVFDLQTGTIANSAGTGVSGSCTTRPEWGGFYRCSVMFTATKAATGTNYIGLQNASATSTYTGDGVSGLYIWGAQLEASATATSYYPTTSAAAARPLGYIDSWQPYTYDSGAQLACPAPAVSLRGFTAAQAASAYAFGGGATGRAWLPSSVSAYGLAVDIVDTASLQGYIEAAYLVAGPYWESATNFDYGASAQLVDSSKNNRNDAGDLISDAGTISKKLSLQLSKLAPSDRASLWSILRSGGIRFPLFLSMFPGDTDLARERDHQVYGKLVQLPAMALPFFNLASATVEVESV